MPRDIHVVILGGCGFLGQHVVAELLTEKNKDNQEGNSNKGHCIIKDIKVIDVKPFTVDCLTSQREDGKTVDYQVCDIRDFENLKEKLKGVSAVINCAAITPDFSKEDLGYGDRMQQVNVQGVKNIVKACQELDIQALIHTSTVTVKMGGKRLLEHTETLSPDMSEDELILGDYARGRLKAERIVLDAHGTKSNNGVTLNSVVLRPPLLYGEGDTSFVPLVYNLAKAEGNRMPSIGNPEAFLQAAYAGNVAVAHVCALKHMMSDEKPSLQTCGGLPVYVTDDTPPNNLSALTTPFLNHVGFEPSLELSYWTVSLHLYWANLKSKIGLQTDGQESCLLTWPLHHLAGTIAVVSRMRAELCLGYNPSYTWEQALKKSNLYYSHQLN